MPVGAERSGVSVVGAEAVGPGPQELLTADQLARRWQVPKSHVYRLTRYGAIPTVKLGRYYRYRLDVIEAFEVSGVDRPPT